MGVDPVRWGPGAWRLLHYLTLRMPEDPSVRVLHAYRQVFTSLPAVLPCRRCRRHLKTAYRRSPPRIGKGRERLVRWFYNVHVHVNRELKKRVVRPRLAAELPGIRKGWRQGLETLMFAIALGLPSRKLPEDARAFVAGCRSILGPRTVPDVSGLRSRAGFLAELRRFFRLSRRTVAARFGRWSSPGSLAPLSGARGRPSGRAVGRGSSRPGASRNAARS